MKDAWEEEKQRLTAAIEREKKLRRDSEMRERRLLDDRLAEALSEGDGMGLKVTRDGTMLHVHQSSCAACCSIELPRTIM